MGPALLAMVLMLAAGCASRPVVLPPEQRVVVDRRYVEYPAGFELRSYITGLTGPTAMAIDGDGALLVAEAGFDGRAPRITGFRPDGTTFLLYPRGRVRPFGIMRPEMRIHGPIGGMTYHEGFVYIAHRDAEGYGMISALGYDGTSRTVVADLPAHGDHGMTDLVMAPNGRLYFGVGSATNSGVVGVDNWARGWARRNPAVSDRPAVDLRLHGYRFDTPNPQPGFTGQDVVVTAPFQPFGVSNQTRIAGSSKPTAAIYSVEPTGGDLRLEAHGIRNPRGLAFNEYHRLFMTNNGMELRGTRPVKDDPDVLLVLARDTWYGWPDFSADLRPISEGRFQPPLSLILRTGYPDLSFLLDHEASNLIRPDRQGLLQARFQPLSGAAKFAFVPDAPAYRSWRGQAIVALSGDRAPVATSGQPLVGPIGFRVVRVDVETRQVRDFIYNTRPGPISRQGRDGRDVVALERPFDVKFAPDGTMYILDLGRLDLRTGRERIVPGTGRVFKLTPLDQPPPALAGS